MTHLVIVISLLLSWFVVLLLRAHAAQVDAALRAAAVGRRRADQEGEAGARDGAQVRLRASLHTTGGTGGSDAKFAAARVRRLAERTTLPPGGAGRPE